MALDMTPEERAVGQGNFEKVAGELTRRKFMKSLAVTGGVILPVSTAAWFGYKADSLDGVGGAVKTALIGSGDEGGVLAGEHNPKYTEIVAVCDLRPTNQKRIFVGETKGPRKGLNYHYGSTADQKIKVYDNVTKMLEERKDIEAVIIALPLFLHAPVAIECMKAGKHVLCEKLMAWNISQCKDMIHEADKNDVCLSIGHQRHYSMLYSHALELMNSGVLGDVRHIRALWHRNNATPQLDASGKPIPGKYKDSWYKDVPKEDRAALEKQIRAAGYKDMEELVRWRLYKRTGGGLMAELGSHQLDACSIFLGKVRPLAVSAVGGKYFYKDDREVEDHVFCTYEFPGKNYWADPEHKQVKDKNDIVVVTYSSISTNSFEPYGECVMGSKGTMVVEGEKSIQLYNHGGRTTEMSVKGLVPGAPAVESSASGSGGERVVAGGAGGAPVSRGYREEMEHFSFCVRMWKQGSAKKDRPMPRCSGPVAMADAIVALTTNLAMEKKERIEFSKHPEWFDYKSKEVPDAENKPEFVTA